MVGKSHQLVSFTAVYSLALLSTLPHQNIQTIVASIILISIGSLTPDLDDPHNKLYTLIPIGDEVFAEVLEKFFGKHRSISHSILGVALFGYASHWLIWMIPEANGFNHQSLWLSFILALIFHLAADAFTKEGIPLFWPLRWKFSFIPIKELRLKTGGAFEVYVVRTLMLVLIAAVTYYKWPHFLEIFRQ